MHEFTEKFGMTFVNFLELGPHSQPKRKLIDILGEWGHYLYLHKKGLHVGTTIIYIGTTRCTMDKLQKHTIYNQGSAFIYELLMLKVVWKTWEDLMLKHTIYNEAWACT